MTEEIKEGDWIAIHDSKTGLDTFGKGSEVTSDSIKFEKHPSKAEELKIRIKEYISENKSEKLLLRAVTNHFRGDLELLHKQGQQYEEIVNYIVEMVSEARVNEDGL